MDPWANVKAYMVTFRPNAVRPNGTEVSVLGKSMKEAVNHALEHVTPSPVEWEVESVVEL